MSVEGEGGATERTSPKAEKKGAKRDASRLGTLSASQYIDGIKTGNRSILAKAITLIESANPADCALGADVLEACLCQDGDPIVVGVSGVPGAGKSSLIEALGKHIITEGRERVAVLAIDPSSRLSGGSILGDKTRMPFLASSDMAFVRPSPSRGTLGGVAAHTRDAIALCEAAGYRLVFVETVGVGQSETAVREMVDFLLLVALAGAGDELQGIKRGVMEMADVVVVNKADGDNIYRAEKTRADAEHALHFLSASASGWVPSAKICSVYTGLGVKEIWSAITEHHRVISSSGYLKRVRREQRVRWLHENVERGLMQMLLSSPVMQQRLAELENEVASGRATPIAGARRLLSLYDSIDRSHLKNQKHQP